MPRGVVPSVTRHLRAEPRERTPGYRPGTCPPQAVAAEAVWYHRWMMDEVGGLLSRVLAGKITVYM